MKPGPLRLIHGFTRALVLIKPLSSPIARVGLPPLYDCSRDHVHSALGNFTPKCPAAAQSARPFHPRNPSANSAYTHPEEGQSDVIHPDEDCPDEEYLEELYAGAEEKGEEHPYDDQDDIMAGSNASSGDKKRKRGAPGFFAVKKGRKPGIYYSWADTFEQVNGFSGAVHKKCKTLSEAEAFIGNGGYGTANNTAASVAASTPSVAPSTASRPRSGKQKWYGVQVGHNPGVYTDYEEVKRQIRGYPGSKQRGFESREDAQAFVIGGSQGTPAYTSMASTAAPSVKDDVDSELSLGRHEAFTERTFATPKASANPPKKRQRFDAVPPVLLPNGELDPGTGPLPEDAEDGFDRTILLNPGTGKIEFKSEAQLSARKWQPTGETTDPLVIYTDGAAPGNGRLGAVAGIGVYFGPQNPNNVSAWLGEGRQTNQRAELAAIKRAVDLAPINRNVLIMSDSNYSIKCVTEWSRNWEQNGWKTSTGKSVENRDLVEPILERLRERALAGGKTELRWVKGHANDEGNVAADALAVEGAEKGRRIMAAMQAAGAEEMGEEEDEEREGDDRGEEWAWIDGPRS